MKLMNLNQPDANPSLEAPAPGEASANGAASTEIAFLKARIAHLESVIETARGLMTANQERLLRRLHDTPREIASLAALLPETVRDAAWRA